MSADLTTEVWRQQWGDFPGGVGEYAPNGKPVEEAGGSLGLLISISAVTLPVGQVSSQNKTRGSNVFTKILTMPPNLETIKQ